ncbi:PTS mannitol transporter subunit IICBA [Deinococcus sp. Leaf326]|uniref:PTS mannitol transporter subunit IICBA n=1 Tax=Deinococcus sp. Leaf326 TaxID=1736338 RepID=UPI0006F5FD4E|nr:PTS mannitol transporter subunit IICBA [Deinococcus sp. Leaf326]KQR26647.1 PTS mannitol transporter subunit IIABC [Deinococcus sp. Leaf326]
MTTNPAGTAGPTSGKDRVQKFGRFLSAMVMPNIGAFIAWGLITALFIPTGWLPNEQLGKLVGPMITYLLPLLIAYTGGRIVADHRGGVLGAIAAMGVIVGTDIPMFIGAMIMGPLGGWVIKQFDRNVQHRIAPGFEMLVNNFSAGIIGMLLAILGFFAVGPVVELFSKAVASGVQFLVNVHLLPLVSLLIEPGKILFLNNAINHGILTPLGTAQAQETGKSIYFLLEANPGPGLGLLLAYWVFAKGSIRSSAPGAAIIHFLGGIHEVYFPYVLMRPILLLGVIAGGMSGVATLVALNGGLVSASSPGSIFAILALTPRGGYFANIAAVVVAAAVSFLVSAVFLRGASYTEDDLASAQADSRANKGGPAVGAPALASAGPAIGEGGAVRKVVFACDAGMGSSAMGATGFRKKVQAAGLPIEVTNTAIDAIPADADIVVTQQNLTSRARAKAPQARHVSIDNFIGNPIYDRMVTELQASAQATQVPAPAVSAQTAPVHTAHTLHAAPGVSAATALAGAGTMGTSAAVPQGKGDVLRRENIVLGLGSVARDQAVVRAGEQLVKSGYVSSDYVPAMLEREKVVSTYIGNGIAIPHGVGAAKAAIKTSGIVVNQYPDGVDFDGERAYLVIGIAGAGDEHLQILSRIADALEDEATVMRLARTRDADEIYRTFTS